MASMYIISAVALLLAGANAFSTHGATAAHSRVFRGRQMQLSIVDRKSVCIVGGGFGGLYSALSIAKKMDAQTDVYLIDPKDSFVFLPLLYELAVGTASSVEVAPRYESLLQGSKIKFIKAAVDSVDFEGKVCKLRGVQGEVPESLKFDQLVVSVGIQPRTDLIPGAKDRSLTLPFYTVTDAFDLKKKLKALKASKKEDISVAVIGGGYSGVEVATNVAQSLGDRVKVTIIDRNNMVMQSSPEHNRRVAEKSLEKFGIDCRFNTSVNAIRDQGLILLCPDGKTVGFDTDLVLFTAGTEQSLFIKSLGLEKDAFGRILTSSTLQSKTYNEVFALGDCAGVEGGSTPCTAQVAMQQSGVVAKNVLRNLKFERRVAAKTARGESVAVTPPKLAEFKYLNLGEMLSLGDTNAAITSLNGKLKLSGPLAAAGRRAIYTVRMPTATQAIKAAITAGAVTTGKLLAARFNK